MKGRGQVNLERATLAAFASYLGQVLGRSVIDKTELTGSYDFKLEWTPDESTGIMRGPGGDGPAPLSDAASTSIFTALQEQLGLKLESAKGPVEILVIERAQKASEN
jgi:bla regulator protein blaR1